MKALIVHEGTEPPRLHHLPTLIDLLLPSYPRLEQLKMACEYLTPYAVHFRYPGEEASSEDAAEAIRLAGQIRARLRLELGLKAIG